jgi:NADH:ubiquinone oxidoreductase subunit 5 (subunit L)/multisubunit Na+/H+ antiporter MnhA subunit
MTNSGNLIVFYLGWEGIALTSIFLVNFWSERVRSIKAAFKVFFINKIGDFFFLILIVLLIGTVGDVNFDVINSNMFLFLNNYFRLGSFEVPYVELVGVILVFSSCVKSAQIGFHI